LVPGITMGVCDGGDHEGVPCVDDSECGGASCGSFCVGKVGGVGGDGGKPCTSGAECSSGNCGTCAGFLLGEEGKPGSSVTVQHKYEVLPADADEGDHVYDGASANGYDVGTDLLFSLTFPGAIQIIECVEDSDCGDPQCNTCDLNTNECVFLQADSPCQADADLCTIDHCDGGGQCVFKENVVCEPANPPCEGGEVCDSGTGTCVAQPDADLSTPCEADADLCTIDHCDGNGACVFKEQNTTDPQCILDCGNAITDQCVVSVSGLADVFCGPPPLGAPSDPSCTKNFDEASKLALQKAIDAAPNGATITVTGRCLGPIRVTQRAGLTITGVKPSDDWECPPLGPAPADLTSTVAGSCDGDLDNCELIKMTESPNVTVQYLNIVDSFNSGLEWKRTQGGVAFCNCIARNAEEGIEFDKGNGGHLALQNLVKENAQFLEPDVDFGIAVHNVSGSAVRANTVVSNLRGGIWLSGDESDANGNTIEFNVVQQNGSDGIGDGIRVESSDRHHSYNNRVTCNTVSGNAVAGISLFDADYECIDKNQISSNGDGLTDEIFCGALSGNNTGSNVPVGSPCCSGADCQTCSVPAECVPNSVEVDTD
jgi:parallel beta-helix repeat protein